MCVGGPSVSRMTTILAGLRQHMVVEVVTDADLAAAESGDKPEAGSGASGTSGKQASEHLRTTFLECDAVLVLGSQFFWGFFKQLESLCKLAVSHGAYMMSNIDSLKLMGDRTWVLRTLVEHGVPTPAFVECVHTSTHKAVLEEHTDYIVVNGTRINKPFVEKPADRRDREIYVYFPQEQGGGRCLVSTRESGDVEYVSRFDSVGCVRREGSYIYHEYLQSEGFTVQTICVGGSAFGNAVPKRLLHSVGLDAGGNKAAEPFAVWLLPEERAIALKLNAILGQVLFGITFVRSQTALGASGAASPISYVVDVWPGVPISGTSNHHADVVRLLRSLIEKRVLRTALRRNQSWSVGTQLERLPDFECPGVEPQGDESQADAKVESSDDMEPKRVCQTEGEERLCTILVARHGERSPKQKLKAKLKMESMFGVGWLFGYLASTRAGARTAVKHPSVLELRASDQLARLASVARELLESGYEAGTMIDALGVVTHAKLACHAKITCTPAAQMDLVLKWGGELTPDAVRSGETFGARFRKEHYDDEDFYQLHASLRHDIKVYSSAEPRCTQTAAAFIRGFLRLDAPLPPVIAELVRTEDFDFLNPDPDQSCATRRADEAKEVEAAEASESATEQEIDRCLVAPWKDLESIIGPAFISPSLRSFDSLADALRSLRSHMETLCKALVEDFHGTLYQSETPSLLRSRYKGLLGDLGKVEGGGRQIMDKAPHVLDCLEYDHAHNFAALPDSAQQALSAALPFAEAVCDLTVPLEVVLPAKVKDDCEGGDNAGGDKARKLLHKLRWDLRVASGGELGTETQHLKKHTVLHMPSESHSCADSPSEPRVRTRMYFSHNSRLLALLSVLLSGAAEEPPRLVPRLGFLSHVLLQLWRSRTDGELSVSCEYARSSTDERQRLFRIPFGTCDALLTAALERGDEVSCASPGARSACSGASTAHRRSPYGAPFSSARV